MRDEKVKILRQRVCMFDRTTFCPFSKSFSTAGRKLKMCFQWFNVLTERCHIRFVIHLWKGSEKKLILDLVLNCGWVGVKSPKLFSKICPFGVSPNGVSPNDHSVQMGVVQLKLESSWTFFSENIWHPIVHLAYRVQILHFTTVPSIF